MKVQAWTDGPVELEADVEFEDVLSSIAQIVEDGQECPNRLLGAIDHVTRILAAVEDCWIERMKPEHRAEIHARLSRQCERYTGIAP